MIHGQLNLFNEIEDIADTATVENENITIIKKKKSKKKEADFSKLATKVIDHRLEDIHCDICGTEMIELAPIIIEVLKYEPARYFIERHIIHQHLCKKCTDDNLEAEIVKAPGSPKRLIKGSYASASVVSGIAFNKFVSGVPLYRQEQELTRKKVPISRANMSNWLMRCCNDKIKPIYQLMCEDMRKSNHTHMDETSVVVLEDKKDSERQKSYMWIATTGKWEEKQMALYFYHINREYAFAKEIIGNNYSGNIHCDGYEAYRKFENATVLGCLAHARRRFVIAMEVDPLHKELKGKSEADKRQLISKNPSYSKILYVINEIKYLFECEAKYIEKKYTPAQIELHRLEDQQKRVDELFIYLEKRQFEFLPKSKMGMAISYALNLKNDLTNYLKDGKAEISNNRGERCVKPFVIGRKNWLFCNTKSGAECSSIYYSIIESAKMNHLDIHKYLEYLLEQLTQIENPTETDLQRLLPYSKQLPASLKFDNI
ncbi:MAG: IS66 family transposase [Bacilli bacterium]